MTGIVSFLLLHRIQLSQPAKKGEIKKRLSNEDTVVLYSSAPWQIIEVILRINVSIAPLDASGAPLTSVDIWTQILESPLCHCSRPILVSLNFLPWRIHTVFLVSTKLTARGPET